MVKTSVLNDALNAINNAEKAGKRQVLIHPSSKVITKFLSVMQRHGAFAVSCIHLSIFDASIARCPGLITGQRSRVTEHYMAFDPLNARQIDLYTQKFLHVF